MIITTFLVLVFIVFLVIGGLKINRFLAEYGALAQKEDKKKKKNTVVQSIASDIGQGIESNSVIRDQLWAKFGQHYYITVGARKEYPIPVTVCVATDSDGSFNPRKYITSASEGWQQNGLDDDFTDATPELSQSEKNRLNAMIQPIKEHTSAERRFRFFAW